MADEAGEVDIAGEPLGPIEAPQEPESAAGDFIPDSLRASLPAEAVAHLERRRRGDESVFDTMGREWQGNRARALRSEQENRDLADQVRLLNQQMQPILQREFQEMRRAEQDRIARMIPEDPNERAAWLAEQTLLENRQAREEEARLAEEMVFAEEAAEMDEAWVADVLERAGDDQQFKADYDLLAQSALMQMRDQWPDAPEEKIHELLSLTQQLAFRDDLRNGRWPSERIRAYAANLRRMAGAGNGNPAPQPSTARTPAQATRAHRNAAAAGAMGTSRSTAQGRAPGGGLDFGSLSEEEFMKAMENPANVAAWREYKSGLAKE